MLPPVPYLLGWRARGAQLADAIAGQDPAFKEKVIALIESRRPKKKPEEPAPPKDPKPPG